MSFWDLAQTAATIAAGVYGGPMAGAAVGGGLSAVRGKDVLMGTVSGAMAGYGGQGINEAASQTALKAGTTNAAINNAVNQGITQGTNAMVPTMTGFGGAGAGTGITTGMNTGVNLGGGYNSGSTGGMTGFSPAKMVNPPVIPKPTMPSYMDTTQTVDIIPKTNYYDTPTATRGTVLDNSTSSYFNPELPPLEAPPPPPENVFANTNNFNPIDTTGGVDYTPTDVAIEDQYRVFDQKTGMPYDGYSFSEKFDAVSNDPRGFMKNLGGGNELYGAGKLGLTGLGLYASAMEPEDPYGDYETLSGNEIRNRGPQGQLNLSNESSLNLNNPYGYAKGGGITTGKSLNVNNIKPNYTAGSLNVNTGSNTPPPPTSVARAVPTSGTNVGGSSNKPFSVDTQFVMGQGTMPADAIMGGPNANYTQDIAGNFIRKAQGGIINGYVEGGYLSGGNVPGDGMSDSIPAMIGRGQQAALSEGEFVVPADVVSHLGNGSSNAGSKQLYAMMDQVRKDRTGTEKQGKQINPERYMPA